MRTILETGSHAGAEGERPVYICPACGVVYDAAPGEEAPECDCGDTDDDYYHIGCPTTDGYRGGFMHDGQIRLCGVGYGALAEAKRCYPSIEWREIKRRVNSAFTWGGGPGIEIDLLGSSG